MTDAARYIKIVEWSKIDGVFVGQCPGLTGPRCHGVDETEVYRDLCQIVEDWGVLLQQEGRPLPPSFAGRNVASLIGTKE